MNGAQSLVETLLRSGVDTCFANPGTSEMHFVAALDQSAGMRCVLGLQENVVTGMADGYYRIAGKSACTLLHCGPGLANGLANLHNARRAMSGIVNIVGDHATYHQSFDAPLTADTAALAHTVSSWVRTSTKSADVGRDAAAAVHAASAIPAKVATLILPSDASWDDGGVVVDKVQRSATPAYDLAMVEKAARVLKTDDKVLILLGGRGVSAAGQELAWRIARATGAAILAEYVCANLPRGQGRLQLERVPYSTERAIELLGRFQHIILVNAKPPVAFFAYPGKPSMLYGAHMKLHVLAGLEQDAIGALQCLCDMLSAPAVPMPDPGARPSQSTGFPTPEKLAQTLAALMPENAIVSDESISYGRGFYQNTHAAAAHDWLHLTGGAIGDGLPVATGAAIAAKGKRRVISLQADGSAMYSLQSLWTQARERLPNTTILLNNRKYNILIDEYARVGATSGPTAMRMLELGDPELDWVKLANGMGVEAARATTMDECADLLGRSFEVPLPFLIELMI